MNQAELILIVEDEEKLANLLADYLREKGGYRTEIILRGDEVIDALSRLQPDLVLLDLMLPGLSGMEVCKQIRAQPLP